MLLPLLLALVAADPTAQQLGLLKTFRAEFVAITPGEGKYPQSFAMGSNDKSQPNQQPAHQVTIGYPFEIARYEVPQNLWEAVMGENPSRWKGKRNSVEMLSFADAEKFCTEATRLVRAAKLIRADQVVRLPSETEWEYAARAGTTTRYSFGSDPRLLDAHGWHTGNAAGNDPEVGKKKPNPWGLYDVHGYLREWCLDAWNDDYADAPADGSPRLTGQPGKRVLRGGSWKDKAEQLTSSYRLAADEATRDDAVGLRCVLAVQASGRRQPPDGVFTPTAQDKIVPADSQIESLWAAGEFTEGPALAPDGSIIFSDIGNSLYRFDPQTDKTALFRQPSGRSNGLMFNQQGELVACEGANTGGGRRISITTGIDGAKDGAVKTLAERFDGKRFNSPNDLAIDAGGNVYFTDPRYVGDDPRELDYEAVFLVSPDGAVRIATRDVQKPNGILVAPDGKSVYVADNNPQGNRHLVAFAVKTDGTLAEKRVLHDFGGGRGIDGMTLDRRSNIYATAGTGDKAGIYVFAPDGKHLAFIPTPGDPTNCVFGGGEDASTLYITAANSKQPGTKYGLFRIKLSAQGHHVVKLK
ncbi:MAG: SMP-30/gluconolactonase/LRE family protein [Pirellulaceae bacterium]